MKFRIRKKQQREIKRFTEYMISGGAYFWSGYVVFFVIDKGIHGSFFWAKSVSTLAGWTVNYLLQRYWVFNNPKLKKHQTEVTGRYILITLVNFVLDYFIVFGLKTVGVTPYIGQFVSSGFFTFWNYAWYKYYVFPEKYPSKASSASRHASRRSRQRRHPSRAAAVSKPPVPTQRIGYTPRFALRFFLAASAGEKHLPKSGVTREK